MARLPYVEAEQAPPDVKATYEKIQAGRGWIPNFMKVLAHYPKGMHAALGMMTGIREGKLDPKLRQIAYLKASRINGCHYWFSHNAALGRTVGLTQEQIDGLDSYASNPVYDELQKAVIRYAEDITENVAASDASFQAVRKKLSEQEMVELSMTIGWANFTNRMNETFQTELEKH